jgi:hypothetical protein
MKPPRLRYPDPRPECGVPPTQRKQRTTCPCGGANTIRVVVEYIDTEHARIDYAGGRFCYRMDARIDIELPADAVPVRAMIYDLHQPDEIIQITFTHRERRMSPDAESELPGREGDRQGNYLALGTASLVNTPRLPLPKPLLLLPEKARAEAANTARNNQIDNRTRTIE